MMVEKMRDGLSELRKEIKERINDLEVRLGRKEPESEIPEEWLRPEATPLENLFEIPPEEEDPDPELAEEPTYKFYEEPESPGLISYGQKIKIQQFSVFLLFLFSLFGAYGVIRADTLVKEWPVLVFHLLTAGCYLDYLRRFRTKKTKKWYLLQDIEK